jgi:hypothetical protein
MVWHGIYHQTLVKFVLIQNCEEGGGGHIQFCVRLFIILHSLTLKNNLIPVTEPN